MQKYSFVRFVIVLALTAMHGLIARAGDIEPAGPILIEAGHIYIAPGEMIEPGQILIENGRIMAVGATVNAPAYAEVFDASDLTVYPAFIDGLSFQGFERKEPSGDELSRWADDTPDITETIQSASVEAYRRLVHPSWRAEADYDPSKAKTDNYHEAGFAAALIAPPTAIMSGRSALILASERPLRRRILNTDVALHAAFVTRGEGEGGGRFGGGRGYPVTTMGAMALFRQTLLDADWHRKLLDWATRHPYEEQPPFDRELDSLASVIDGDLSVAFLANSADEIHRALNMAAEFKLRPMIVGGREAWKVTERLKTENVPVILSLKWVDEPKAPKGPTKESEDASTKPSDDGSASDSTWSARATIFDDDWQDRAWSSRAEFEEKRRLWGEQVDNGQRLHEAGVAFAIGSFDLDSLKDLDERLKKAVKRGLPADAAVAALTTTPAKWFGVESIVGAIESGKLANLTMVEGDLFGQKSKIRWVFVEGRPFRIEGKTDTKKDGGKEKAEPEKDEIDFDPAPTDDESEPSTRTDQTDSSEESDDAVSDDEKDDDAALAAKLDKIDWPEFPCEIEADRKPRLETGGNVLLRNATLLTIEDGDLSNTDLLIRDGKISQIGKSLALPPGVMEFDLTGYCVSPGLIDPHSHMCSSGGLNEWSLSVTPEVRVRDVVDSTDKSAWRALAGGVTTIHTMHGSANTIGGQNATLRLKYGKPAIDWLFAEAPRTVKFALGENVKGSNSNNRRNRFPATRMGVEAVMRRSFDVAEAYQREREMTTSGRELRPRRRDLRLEALVDVRKGDIWVHCHCYRADEVLRLLSVAEDYGFRIGVLQHILEGYRVMPEIYRHGCSASTFSDWWAYKIEAYNAIPHNAARMEQAGIVTTVNSDSGEVIRHLNLEAAKSMRFGGLSPNEAMRLVTLNGAIQLGVDKYVGSLAVGKFGDIAVFDGHPLDTRSKCVLTLIDGEAYFQHPDFDATAPATPREIKSFAKSRELLHIDQNINGAYWLTGATVYPVASDPIENVVVAIRDGRIESVGTSGRSAPDDATAIDASGLRIYPGLINVGVQLGLLEIESVAGTDDQRSLGTFQPDLHALSAYDPFSTMVNISRSEGVLAAMVPPNGGAIAGQGGVVRLDGWSMPEARIKDGVGLFVTVPSLSEESPWWLSDEDKKKRKEEYPKKLAELEEFFRAARRHVALTDAQQPVDPDRRLDAMRPYLDKSSPVYFRANSYKQIVEALTFADKYDVRPVIYGAREAWKLADELATKNVDVVIVRSMEYPRGDYEPFDSVYRNAAVLANAGVRFAFATAEPSLAKQLGIEAGMAVAYGLDEKRAIRAMTLDAAEIIGVADRLGSLETGKSADLIVTTDSPIQASNRVVAAFIAGRPVDLSNKHTELDQRWLQRPKPTLPAAPKLAGPPPMRLK